MGLSLQKNSIGKSFSKYVSFNVLSMLGMSAYILADTFFVANTLGNAGITALNIVLPFFSLLNGFGLILGIGGASRYSQAVGAGETEKANRIFTEVVIIAIALGTVCMLTGTIGARGICRLLGADESIIELAVEYLRTVSYFAIPFVLNYVVQSFVRNDGAPTLTMIAMLTSSFGNVLFDYILMYPFGLGMFGASFATGFSPLLSLAIMSLHFIRKKNNFKLIKPIFKWEDIKFTITTGLPAFITEMSNGIVIIFFNMIIYKLAGNVGISAYSVVANISLVAIFCFNGVGQGTQPLVSYNFGARQFKNVKLSFLYGLLTAFCLGVIFYLCFYFGQNWLVKIFNKDNVQQMTILGKQGITIYCTAFFVSGINLVCYSYFSSINRQLFSFIISISRGMVFPIILIFINSNAWGLTGVWMVAPMSEAITLIVSGVLVFISNKKIGRKGNQPYESDKNGEEKTDFVLDNVNSNNSSAVAETDVVGSAAKHVQINNQILVSDKKGVIS